MKMVRFGVALCGVLLAAWSAGAEESWRFLCLADWHWAEKYIFEDPNAPTPAMVEDVATVKMLKKQYGGELIMLPGDSNGGRWTRPKFINSHFPGSTPQEAVLEAGRRCYSGMINSFRKGGYSTLLMAVGDHEIGDNPWRPGSDVSQCLPQFREAFAKEFNVQSDGGAFAYEAPIGAAASRPLGTAYEQTSYAYRHKNVLFITLDVFHQENPNKRLGEEGSVTGTVEGEHLRWLESVLSEARKDSGIKHIMVQSHLPVIYPVRKVSSSGMMMDQGEENALWTLLRKYGVDIYFAGEVHANTATKDSQTDLIQLVTRGNFFNNFQTVDISDDRIEVVCYNQKIGTEPSAGDYSPSGRLVIDKSGPKTVCTGEGEFALLDPRGRHFHYSFEELVPLSRNPIMGHSGRAKKKTDFTLRGQMCSEVVPNLGEFGAHYSALTTNLELVPGVKGKAGSFDASSRMGVLAMGPHRAEKAVSYALWVKTTASGNLMLINSASCWNKKVADFMNLNLNNGVPEVMISADKKLKGATKGLNDGTWHHLAVSMPADGCRLSEVQLFVDGRAVETTRSGADAVVRFNQAVRLGFGGLNYSSKAFDVLKLDPFVGELDEISIWTRPLSAEEVKAEFAAGADAI